MSEQKIKPQCEDCPYYDARQLPVRDKERLKIRGLHMALEGTEEFPDCKHPWRLMNAVYGTAPSPEQVLVLSSLVKIRGKDPELSGVVTNNNQAGGVEETQ